MAGTLILGSAPNAPEAALWPREAIGRIIAINNAWRIRQDWDECIFPWDFPPERQPLPRPGQRLVTEADFVPAQNRLGGFVYAGGTMAFTACYWALDAHAPPVIAVFGCDMQYPRRGPNAFYGDASADPLRDDITLRSLEAKSARLMVLAAMRGTAMVNLSARPSRLVFPRARPGAQAACRPAPFDRTAASEAQALEDALGYEVPSGRYWEEAGRFDPAALEALDKLWIAAARIDTHDRRKRAR